MTDESFLDGEHAAFLEQLYGQYQQDPHSIAPQWQAYFQRLDAAEPALAAAPLKGQVLAQRSEQLHVSRLLYAYR